MYSLSPPENRILIRCHWTELFSVTFKRKHTVYRGYYNTILGGGTVASTSTPTLRA
jgi:hypothetical protein